MTIRLDAVFMVVKSPGECAAAVGIGLADATVLIV